MTWLLRSVDHYHAFLQEDYRETPAILTGRAIHSFCLDGEEQFSKQYAVAPDVDKRNKEGKVAYLEFEQQLDGRTPITHDTFVICQKIRDSLLRHPFAKSLISAKGETEVSYFWTDEETQIKMKCRTDAEREGMALVDLKTNTDASAKSFSRDAINFGYYRQAAHYFDGANKVRQHLGLPTIDSFCFIAVEKEPPYACNVFEMAPECVTFGRMEVRKCLKIYQAYLADTKQWTGYPLKVNEITLPKWMQGEVR